MPDTIKKIKNLGKDTIIELAQIFIAEKHQDIQIDYKYFDISVWANTNTVEVRLIRIVPYTPLRFKGTEPPFYMANISFGLTVQIISTTECRLSNWDLDDFFISTQEDLDNLAFLEAHFGLHQEFFDTKVFEEENYFTVEVDNDVSFGRYFIDKETGKQTIPPMQGSYDLNPFPEVDNPDDPNRMVKMD